MGSISQSIPSARCDMCWRLQGNHTEADLANQFPRSSRWLVLASTCAAGTVPLLCLRWQSRYEELLHLRGRRMSPNGSRQVRVCSECKRRGYPHHEFSVAMRADRKEAARTSKPSCHRQTLMSAQNPHTGRTRRPASRRTQRYDPLWMDGKSLRLPRWSSFAPPSASSSFSFPTLAVSNISIGMKMNGPGYENCAMVGWTKVWQ